MLSYYRTVYISSTTLTFLSPEMSKCTCIQVSTSSSTYWWMRWPQGGMWAAFLDVWRSSRHTGQLEWEAFSIHYNNQDIKSVIMVYMNANGQCNEMCVPIKLQVRDGRLTVNLHSLVHPLNQNSFCHFCALSTMTHFS